jgi:class 3 adenylate cyclase/pimeloyl-ACP methyl ester carboxylesterase
VRPSTMYVTSAEAFVAYQVFGEGPRDLLFISNWGNNIDAMWDEPLVVQFFRRLQRLGRVILFDKRGSGVSDPVPLGSLPKLEEWMDDALLVLDAVGSEQAVVIGDAEGGPVAMLLAASHPDRCRQLVLVNTFARWLRAPDYPIGMPPEAYRKLLAIFAAQWGRDPTMLAVTAPSLSREARMAEWQTRYQRLSMAPGAAAKMYTWVTRLDVKSVLAAISVPTLVVHRQENIHFRVAFGRYLAEHIAGARLVELPGADCYPFFSPESDAVLREIEGFVTDTVDELPTSRELATVLFTDIVGSTDVAARLGDERWLGLRAMHDEIVRRNLAAYRGREVTTTGDGFLATFDGPARALTAAAGIRDAVASIGLDLRIGVHTGEIERVGCDIGGIAVHLAARIMSLAQPGEILVSGTVTDLVVGSGIEFVDRGSHTLKGVPGTWHLYAVGSVP